MIVISGWMKTFSIVFLSQHIHFQKLLDSFMVYYKNCGITSLLTICQYLVQTSISYSSRGLIPFLDAWVNKLNSVSLLSATLSMNETGLKWMFLLLSSKIFIILSCIRTWPSNSLWHKLAELAGICFCCLCSSNPRAGLVPLYPDCIVIWFLL